MTLTEQSLALGNSDFQGAYLRFNLTNKRGAEFILSYSQDNFSAVDNLGRPVPAVRVWQRNNGSNFDAVDKKFTGQAVFKPNETVDLPFQTGSVNYYGKDKLLLQADITQTAVTALLVTVTGISGIEGATWRIPINH